MAEKGEKTGKKQKKKKAKMKKSAYYAVKDGRLERKKQTCPKCGPGIFLAEHKDRLVCGNCAYTKWTK
ncbi:MAG: 30S ribosomal protein S27ae [Candidatus Diapherotrites archaeon]